MSNSRNNLARFFHLFILQSFLCIPLIAAKATEALEREKHQGAHSPSSSYIGRSLSAGSTILIERADHTLHSIPVPIEACTLSQLFIAIDQQVKRGDKLCTVQAMKMEFILITPFSGKIRSIDFFEESARVWCEDNTQSQPLPGEPIFPLQTRKENKVFLKNGREAQPLLGETSPPSYQTGNNPLVTLPNGKVSSQDDESDQQAAMSQNIYRFSFLGLFKNIPNLLPQPALTTLEMTSYESLPTFTFGMDNSGSPLPNNPLLTLRNEPIRAQPLVRPLQTPTVIDSFIKKESPPFKKKLKKRTQHFPSETASLPKSTTFQDTLSHFIITCAQRIAELLILGQLLLITKIVTHAIVERLFLYARKLGFIMTLLPKTVPVRVAFYKNTFMANAYSALPMLLANKTHTPKIVLPRSRPVWRFKEDDFPFDLVCFIELIAEKLRGINPKKFRFCTPHYLSRKMTEA